MRYKNLVIGKTPPPIGGVTVHVQRLLKHLDRRNINFHFIPLQIKNIFKIISAIFKSERVHLHSSNVHIRFLAAFFFVIIGKELIITFHGNIGRYGKFSNFLDINAIKLCSIPIVLNKYSYKKSKKVNNNSQLISAFIPPVQENTSNSKVSNSLTKLRKKYENLFCTNAFDVSFDKNGDEIYGITPLVKLFNQYSDRGLIVSDPSGNYYRYIIRKGLSINENIKFLNFEHSFINVLKETDCFIRATTTDGDSLSVREALFLGKLVICSDCVDRPKGCIIFNKGDFDQLNRILSNLTLSDYDDNEKINTSNIDKLINIYNE